MTLVQNHRQLLSGNNFFLIAAFFAILSGCSPKTTTPPVKRPDKPGELPKQEQPKVIELKPSVNSIALILPFNLDNVDPQSANLQEISKSEIAIDFFQGVKLALDSLKNRGYHFKLEVFDGYDEIKAANLARASSVMASDLIIGPVFPDQIKTFSDVARLDGKLQVSPLAASMPSQFNNPNLVTINNNIDQHGWKIADYIVKQYSVPNTNIVLVNTRTSDSEKLAAPVRKYLNSLSGNKLKVTEVTNSKGIEGVLSKSKNNVVIIADEEQTFVVPTINRLYTLRSRSNYKVVVFGHPNWNKLDIDPDQLQMLNTMITSSYTIDYDSEPVKNFVSKYHAEFKLDPSEYSFKGFDTAYYFGELLGEFGKDYIKNLSRPYEGLHNNFKFSYDATVGFQNTEIKLLKYEDYELHVVK